MNMIFVFLFLIFFPINDAFSQSEITISNPRREIRYFHQENDGHKSFSRQENQLSVLICRKIEAGTISPYYVRLDTFPGAKKLSLESYKKRLLYEAPLAPVWAGAPSPKSPEELGLMGFDQTIGMGSFDEKEYAKVHYVHFYADGDDDMRGYLFSVLWEDFIRTLDEHPELLFYTNSHEVWWKGDILITNDYFSGYNLAKDMVHLNTTAGLPILTFPDRKPIRQPFTYLDSLRNYGRSGANFSISLKENYKKDHFELAEIIIKKEPDPYIEGDTGKKVVVLWKDFLKVSADSNWQRHCKEVCTISEAIRLQKFNYCNDSKEDTPFVISRNGYFIGNEKLADPLCSTQLTPSFVLTTPRKTFNGFCTIQSEFIEVSDTIEPQNIFLNFPGHRLSEIIFDNIKNGKLPVYSSPSSLSKPLSLSQSLSSISLKVSSSYTQPLYYKELSYYKGMIGFKEPKSIEDEPIYYIITENIPYDTVLTEQELQKYLIPFERPLYKPEQINAYYFKSKVSFDTNGKNKQYELIALELWTIDDLFNIGYPISLSSIKWADLKKILLTDKRAIFRYKGKKVNLVTLIETRAFTSTINGTQYLNEK